MMKFAICESVSGEIVSGITRSDGNASSSTPFGHVALAIGQAQQVSHLSHYMLQGALVAYTDAQSQRKARRPALPASWSNQNMRWVSDPSSAEYQQAAVNLAIARRHKELLESDWVVIRANESGGPVPEQWRAYRAALRDITDQAGFPVDINWPVAP